MEGGLLLPWSSALPSLQVTLLDFGASRDFRKEFTDHYIEASPKFLPRPAG